jgi:hypothetical protein
MFSLKTVSVTLIIVTLWAGLVLGGGCASPSEPLAEQESADEAISSTAEQKVVSDIADAGAADAAKPDAREVRDGRDRELEVEIEIEINIGAGDRDRDDRDDRDDD